MKKTEQPKSICNETFLKNSLGTDTRTLLEGRLVNEHEEKFTN